jgi:dTDP-4-amino-4,6-dideoxygalactose transaminase
MRLTDAEIGAALDCLAGGWLTMGPRIQAFEGEVAGRLGVPHAIAVSSAGAALQLAATGAGVGPGARVAVSALAPPGAFAALRRAGAEPVAVDPGDPAAPGIAVPDVDVRAIVVPHLYGHPADADASGLIRLDDAADALGAVLRDGRPAGVAGTAGRVSLADGRLLGVGEGGLIVTGDEAVAARARSLRSHAMTSVTWDRHRGHADSYDVVDIGFNARLDEPRAALASARLERVDALLAARRAVVADVRAALAGGPVGVLWAHVALDRCAPQAVGLLAAGAAQRDALAARLRARGLAAALWPAGPDVGAAAEVRARSVLVDLAGAESDPAAIAASIAST